MSTMDTIKTFFGHVVSAPVERTIADMLDKANVQESKFSGRVDGRPFLPGDSYFGVRLAGLHVVNARKFATQQLPLFVCLAEFDHGGQRRSIPFSVGPDVIRSKLRAAVGAAAEEAKPAWVELRDIPVIWPTPVTTGNLSLYAGLFSVPGDDLVKNLLNVVGTVGSTLAQPAIASSVEAAQALYKSFGSLLSVETVNQLAAALIGTALTDVGSGYLLIANANTGQFDPARGRVINGRLHWPADVNGGGAVVEFDHVLLAVEHYRSIVEDATGLAPSLFQSAWLAALALPREQAAWAFSKLQDMIASSPDLTESDRIALLTGYSLRFEQIAAARGWPKPPSTTRGEGDAELKDRMTQLALSLDEDAKKSIDRRDDLAAQAQAAEAQLAQMQAQQQKAQAQALYAIASLTIDPAVLPEDVESDEALVDRSAWAAARSVRARLDELTTQALPTGRLSSLLHRSMRLTDL